MSPQPCSPKNNTLSRRSFITTSVGCAAAVQLAAATHSTSTETINRSAKPPIVDTHMHVWAKDTKRFPFDHPYAPNFTPPKIAATVEELVADMDRGGVTHCILVQTIYHGWDNTYTADCVKRYPGRFKGHGLIDPTKPDVAEKLEFWMQEHGLAGMRLSPIYYADGQYGGDGWMTSAAHHRLWQKASELGAVFNIFISPRQLPKLEVMLRQHPEVKVTVDHLAQIDLGGPDTGPAMKNLLSLAGYPNVWVKVSELTSVSKSGKYPFADAYPWVKRVYDTLGPDHLIWGTGYPGATRAQAGRPTLKQELDLIQTKMPFLNADDKAKILGLNAQRIWGLQ